MSDETDYYSNWAQYYDAIYHWKPYGDEAARVRDILAENSVADGSRVLEAACGTGAYLEHLVRWYVLTGFDVSESMLQIARSRVPDASIFHADMTSFTVDEPFDALLCLFSSIGYLHSEVALAKAAGCFAKALKPGGCIVIDPWVAPGDYETGMPTQHTFESEDLKLCRSIVSKRQGNMAVLDFHWLVTRRGADVEHFVDRHELWMCEHEQMATIFKEAGFEISWREKGFMKGRGLFVGRLAE